VVEFTSYVRFNFIFTAYVFCQLTVLDALCRALWYINMVCACVLAGPEGGTVTVGDYYRAAKYRKLNKNSISVNRVTCCIIFED